jgi:hypothetical protein
LNKFLIIAASAATITVAQGQTITCRPLPDGSRECSDGLITRRLPGGGTERSDGVITRPLPGGGVEINTDNMDRRDPNRICIRDVNGRCFR